MTLWCTAFLQSHPGLPQGFAHGFRAAVTGTGKHTRTCKAHHSAFSTISGRCDGGCVQQLLPSSVDVMGTTTLPGSASVKAVLRTRVICGHGEVAVVPPSSLTSQGCPSCFRGAVSWLIHTHTRRARAEWHSGDRALAPCFTHEAEPAHRCTLCG